MEELLEVTVGAGRARIGWDYGIARINVSGILGPELYWRLASELADIAEHLPTFSGIVRTDQAVLAITKETMTESAARLSPETWKHLRVPVAWVVSPVNYELAIWHVWQCAERGIERSVFTELSPALSWARAVVARALAPRREHRYRSVAGIPEARLG